MNGANRQYIYRQPAKTVVERWRPEAKYAAKRANDLVAELYDLTCEHVEMVALRGQFDQRKNNGVLLLWRQR
jgi:hypothetical protein